MDGNYIEKVCWGGMDRMPKLLFFISCSLSDWKDQWKVITSYTCAYKVGPLPIRLYKERHYRAKDNRSHSGKGEIAAGTTTPKGEISSSSAYQIAPSIHQSNSYYPVALRSYQFVIPFLPSILAWALAPCLLLLLVGNHTELERTLLLTPGGTRDSNPVTYLPFGIETLRPSSSITLHQNNAFLTRVENLFPYITMRWLRGHFPPHVLRSTDLSFPYRGEHLCG